jgi:4-diphosphocytidyl-2-C-methyl-D-erythritol kinase
VKTITVFSPAKLNLFLAVTGRRADGFHDLISLAAPVAWGDSLTVEAVPLRSAGTGGEFTLECDDPAVPAGEKNLVLQAAREFRAAVRWRSGARFVLEKRIPMGAGLGGGSSNAAAALRVLNELAGRPLDGARLAELAARVGSDCALFLPRVPVVMRGRGERVEPVRAGAAARLRGRRVLIFKPEFSVATAWAYERLAASAAYVPPAEAEARLSAWLDDPAAPAESLLFNSMEPAVFEKYVALSALLGDLRARFGLGAGMSGSGSACFLFLPQAQPPPTEALTEAVRAAWGPSAALIETTIR